jgi:hypothetical protein
LISQKKIFFLERILPVKTSFLGLNRNSLYYGISIIKSPKGTLFNGFVSYFLQNTKNINPTIVYLALLENLVESGIDFSEFINEQELDIDKIRVFQGWDEEAFEEDESEAFKRQELFEKIFRCMIT